MSEHTTMTLLEGFTDRDVLLQRSRLRHELVERRERLRTDEMIQEQERALAERNAIASTVEGNERALGANAEARQRALTLALGSDVGYQQALGRVLAGKRTIESLEAQIADADDVLRLRGWARAERERESRDRFSDALLAGGLIDAEARARDFARRTADQVLRHSAAAAPAPGPFPAARDPQF